MHELMGTVRVMFEVKSSNNHNLYETSRVYRATDFTAQLVKGRGPCTQNKWLEITSPRKMYTSSPTYYETAAQS